MPPDVHALLKRAAELHGQTLTDFEVTAARDAACRRIEEAEIIRISVEHQRLLFPSCFAAPGSPHLLWAAHSGDAVLFLLRSGSAGSLLPTPGAARCPPPCRYRLVAVAAFYTLASPSIPKPVLSLEATKRLPRYPSIPAVRIGRLTVALNFQGRGLAAALLCRCA